jgi:hypothetical protein
MFLVLVLASCASAAIQISPPVIVSPVIYPANVDAMSAAEFYAWATAYNQKAQAAHVIESRWLTYGVTMEYRDGSYRVYEPRYLNPDYSPQPLTIVNPYCKPARNQ